MKNRNFGLDFVRMCAILFVLADHYMTFAVEKMPPIFYVLGDSGVTIFFALSGFLIGGIILRDFENGFSWKVARNFYVRRWMRTVPLYWTFFLVSMFVTFWGFTLDHNFSVKCLAYLAFLQNLAWPMPDWFQESWSLAVEEWFYLLFPILFAALPGIRPRTRVLLISIALTVVPLALRIFAYDPSVDFDSNVRRVVVMRLDAIAYGIFAAWAVQKFDLRKYSGAIGAVGFASATLAMLMMLGEIYPGDFFMRTIEYSLMSASFAAIVVWFSYQSFPRIGLVQWISTRSYALYLCNSAVYKLMMHYDVFARTQAVSLYVFVICCALLAEAAHRLIEQPLMRRRPVELHSVIPHGVDHIDAGHRAGAEARVAV
ncbi:acyltransferase family protein [Pseudomonas sp. TWP3-1]|uniref:acyltransferase family protein n=1 Tax=Pseudomonas sp. TWP3-1 TaxID=2804631 RepID=UPI003CEB3E8A